MRRSPLTLAAVMIAAPMAQGQTITWETGLVDPGAPRHGPADLVLPMPCGGGMAFSAVAVPIDPGRPTSDARVRLGRTDGDAFLDFVHDTPLRGAFLSEDGSESLFYIGRYEVTEAQYAAVMTGSCQTGGRRGRMPQGNVSWFDAVDFARRYTEFLKSSPERAFPPTADSSAFLRLPTEAEWEYAARGGSAVSDTEFGARLFPMTSGIADYAVIHSPWATRGQARPVGLLKPNPLGLFDTIGNMEELIHEPFRINVGGRLHGQPGGLLTKGGWFGTDARAISTALRSEYPFFSADTGDALALASFGFRLVVSAAAVQDDVLARRMADEVENSLRPNPAASNGDILESLERHRRASLDPQLRIALTRAQDEIAAARAQLARANTERAIQVMLKNAAAALAAIREDVAAIPDAQSTVDRLNGYMVLDTDAEARALFEPRLNRAREDLSERITRLFVSLATYRSNLTWLSEQEFEMVLAVQVAKAMSRSDTIPNDVLAGLDDDVIDDLERFRRDSTMSDDDFLDLAQRRPDAN